MGFTLTNPISRVPFLAARKINIVFHFAEAASDPPVRWREL
jgi:hypothetical protein